MDVGQKMIGLTKEELEHFKNDPCWKRIRFVDESSLFCLLETPTVRHWLILSSLITENNRNNKNVINNSVCSLFLFALFWLLWAAMFIGAILIVVLSPKCAEKQQPKWWQTKVSYQVNKNFDIDELTIFSNVARVN